MRLAWATDIHFNPGVSGTVVLLSWPSLRPEGAFQPQATHRLVRPERISERTSSIHCTTQRRQLRFGLRRVDSSSQFANRRSGEATTAPSPSRLACETRERGNGVARTVDRRTAGAAIRGKITTAECHGPQDSWTEKCGPGDAVRRFLPCARGPVRTGPYSERRKTYCRSLLPRGTIVRWPA